jgi:DNA-binding IclR family transcriptional regulator
MPADSPLSGKTVGAVTNAISILRYLNEATRPLGLSQIARHLNLHPSNCFNILRTLAREELVYFDSEAKTYCIGLGMIELAKGATLQIGDVYSIRPHMVRLAQDENVAVVLWRKVSETRMMLVMGALGSGSIRIQINVGLTLPLVAGAAGRVMAAFSGMSAAGMRDLFSTVRWDNPLSFTAFQRQVDETRRRGYSVDEGNLVHGMVTIAVPVQIPERQVTLCCAALLFAGQCNPETGKRVIGRLKTIASGVAQLTGEE